MRKTTRKQIYDLQVDSRVKILLGSQWQSLPVKPFYQVREIQELLSIRDRHTIYAWIREGKLKAFKEGRVLRIPLEALLTFLEERIW